VGQARLPVAFSDRLPTKVHASASHPRSPSTAGPPSLALFAIRPLGLWSPRYGTWGRRRGPQQALPLCRLRCGCQKSGVVSSGTEWNPRLGGAACLPAETGSIGRPAPEIYCDVMPCGFMPLLPRPPPLPFCGSGLSRLAVCNQRPRHGPHLLTSSLHASAADWFHTWTRKKHIFLLRCPSITPPRPRPMPSMCVMYGPFPNASDTEHADRSNATFGDSGGGFENFCRFPSIPFPPQKTPSQPVPHW